MGIVKTMKMRQIIGMVKKVGLKSYFKTENNSINLKYNMFSNIYFLSHICSMSKKLIHKITFSLQTCFLVWGHLTFGIK
jgi:hypothetical protein